MSNQGIPEVQVHVNEGSQVKASVHDNDNVPVGESATTAGTSVRKRKTTSVVWKEFVLILKDKTIDGRQRAKCKACGNEYLADSDINGTGSLKRHMKSCLKRKNQDVAQMLLRGGDGTIALRSKKIDAEVVRDMITTLIVRQDGTGCVAYPGINSCF